MPKPTDQQKPISPASTVEAAPAARTSTQGYLDIDQVREGVVVLKDGSMRIVLHVSAANFELKSEIERDSIIYAYQNFLNSIDFPIQIIVQSRRLELDNYLDGLRGRVKEATNELLKMQTTEYIGFIERLIEVANIMDKKFYVVIPHYPSAGAKKVGAFSQMVAPSKGTVRISNFDEEKKYLVQKVETVASGLQGVGLRAMQLNTQELIELYYNVYNPDQASVQKLIDISQLESEIVEKLPEEMEIG